MKQTRKKTIKAGVVYRIPPLKRKSKKQTCMSVVREHWITKTGKVKRLGTKSHLTARIVLGRMGIDSADPCNKQKVLDAQSAIRTVIGQIMDYDSTICGGAVRYRPSAYVVTRDRKLAFDIAVQATPATHGKLRRQSQRTRYDLTLKEQDLVGRAHDVLVAVAPNPPEPGHNENYEFDFEVSYKKEA